MPNSLERFTAEQFNLVRDEIRAKFDQDKSAEEELVTQLVTILGEECAVAQGMALMRQACMLGHSVCCPSIAISLFATGFIHGWKAREMLMETDELEKAMGIDSLNH